jgi:hypothetical protein
MFDDEYIKNKNNISFYSSNKLIMRSILNLTVIYESDNIKYKFIPGYIKNGIKLLNIDKQTLKFILKNYHNKLIKNAFQERINSPQFREKLLNLNLIKYTYKLIKFNIISLPHEYEHLIYNYINN